MKPFVSFLWCTGMRVMEPVNLTGLKPILSTVSYGLADAEHRTVSRKSYILMVKG